MVWLVVPSGSDPPVRVWPRRLPVPLRSVIAGVGNPAARAGLSAPRVRSASIPLEARVRKAPMPSAPVGWAS
jgi:hypothetical protein